MIQAEFNAWLDHHRAYFPGVETWLAKLPDRQMTLKAWSTILEAVPLSIAKEASDKLYGEATIPVYERHAARVKRIAAELQQKRSRQQQTARFGSDVYRCRLCRDRGLVAIYVVGELLRRTIANIGLEAAANRSALVACNCEAGYDQRKHAIDYDPKEHIVCQSASWHYFQQTRPDDYDRRGLQVEQAKFDLENGYAPESEMQPVNAETEF